MKKYFVIELIVNRYKKQTSNFIKYLFCKLSSVIKTGMGRYVHLATRFDPTRPDPTRSDLSRHDHDPIQPDRTRPIWIIYFISSYAVLKLHAWPFVEFICVPYWFNILYLGHKKNSASCMENSTFISAFQQIVANNILW